LDQTANPWQHVRSTQFPLTMRVSLLFCFVLLASTATQAQAAPRRIALAPPASEVDFRAYGLGLLPIDARFTRFTGTLAYDPDDHATCHVELTVDATSLLAQDASLHDTIVGPDFMDAAHFPSLDYAGNCQADGLAGTLGMHGIIRPFALSLAWSRDQVMAEGSLLRADWGMTAMPILGGRTVRIRVTVPLTGPISDSRN
jgi:polyisoprenoid-binding protein YceI